MSRIPEGIWNELISIAKADGIISKDEEAMLSSIKKNLETYYEKLEEEIRDNRNDLQVLNAQLEIMKEAYEIANEDNIISDDELELLKQLQIIVRRLNEGEI